MSVLEYGDVEVHIRWENFGHDFLIQVFLDQMDGSELMRALLPG